MTVLAGGLALTFLGMAAWACSSTDTGNLEDQIDQLTQQVADLRAREQQAEMVTALYILNTAGLHGIDEAANAGEELPEGAGGAVDRALLAVAITDWPDHLQGGADGMKAALEELAAALDGEDAAAIASAATTVHDTQHDFADEAGAMLNAAAGLESEEHKEGETTGTPSPTP
jgi:hypothetical protein